MSAPVLALSAFWLAPLALLTRSVATTAVRAVRPRQRPVAVLPSAMHARPGAPREHFSR